MKSPIIGPIVAHNVRGFLRGRGVEVHPGMTLDEALSALYVALNERKDDETFWGPLAELMDAVFACADQTKRADADHASVHSFVRDWKTESVFRDLRASLPGGRFEANPSVVKRFAAKLSGPVLTGFLMLGIAASSGCRRVGLSETVAGDTDTDTDTHTYTDSYSRVNTMIDTLMETDADTKTDTQTDADTSLDSETEIATETETAIATETAIETETASETETAIETETATETETAIETETASETATATKTEWFDGCALPQDSILFSVLKEVDFESPYETDTETARKLLCECFASLNQSWSDGLTELFSTATDEEISAVLTEMYTCCSYNDYQLDSNYEEVQEDFLAGYLCYLPLPYKGVSFPSDDAT